MFARAKIRRRGFHTSPCNSLLPNRTETLATQSTYDSDSDSVPSENQPLKSCHEKLFTVDNLTVWLTSRMFSGMFPCSRGDFRHAFELAFSTMPLLTYLDYTKPTKTVQLNSRYRNKCYYYYYKICKDSCFRRFLPSFLIYSLILF